MPVLVTVGVVAVIAILAMISESVAAERIRNRHIERRRLRAVTAVVRMFNGGGR